MDDATAVRKIMHFYYCLLISIRMSSYAGVVFNRHENARIIKKWLRRAKRNKLFDPIVCNEINWLIKDVDKYTPLQFEEIIKKIYLKTKNILDKKELLL